MSNALDEFKGVADAGITPDDNPGLEAFVEGAGEMPAPQPLVELVKPAKKGDNVLIQNVSAKQISVPLQSRVE